MNPFIMIDGRLMAVTKILGVYPKSQGIYNGCIVIMDNAASSITFDTLTVEQFKEKLDEHMRPPKAVLKPRSVNLSEPYHITQVINNPGPPVGEPVL